MPHAELAMSKYNATTPIPKVIYLKYKDIQSIPQYKQDQWRALNPGEQEYAWR